MKAGLGNAGRSAPARRQLSLILLGWSALVAAACLYDADDRCRDGRLFQDGLCVCPAGTIDKDKQCVAKTAAPSGLGEPCDADMPCGGEQFSVCQMTVEGGGYCTTEGCTDDADCGGDFYCAKDADPPFCRRTPTGVGTTCATHEDCAQFDADYCLDGASVCVFAHCSGDDSCPPGTKCQDYSAFLPGSPKFCAP